jgi:predicted transcriptional regulator
MTTKEYRGRNAIIALMLRTINDSQGDGATRTSIMYKSYLSHAQLKEYLSFLMEKSLVDEFPKRTEDNKSSQKNVYKITEKGVRLLQISKEIENLMGLD